MTFEKTLPLWLATLGVSIPVPCVQAASQMAVKVEISSVGPDGAVTGKKWLVFLHGGGSCNADEACAERWYDPNASPDGFIGFHGNMTAATAPTTNFNGESLLDFDGVDSVGNQGINPFVGFNRIMVPYCSSDTHSGRNVAGRAVNYPAFLGTQVTIGDKTTTLQNPAGFPPLTSIRFAGGHIVDAVIDLVMNGGVKTGNDGTSFVEPPSATFWGAGSAAA